MLNKAELTTEELLKLILAAAGIFLLIFLMYRLISPTFNQDDETAKSYFEALKKAIASADAGRVGEFNMWQKNEHVAMVYFGNKSYLRNEKGEVVFYHAPSKNLICVCATTKTACDNCMPMNFPLMQISPTLSRVDSDIRTTGNKTFFAKQGEYYYIFDKMEDYNTIIKRIDLIPKEILADVGQALKARVIYNSPSFEGCRLNYPPGDFAYYFLIDNDLMKIGNPNEDVNDSTGLNPKFKDALIKNCPKDAK